MSHSNDEEDPPDESECSDTGHLPDSSKKKPKSNADLGYQPVGEQDREFISEWIGRVQPELRIHILQEIRGGLTVRAFNDQFRREHLDEDNRPWNNIKKLIQCGLAMETTRDGDRTYQLTALGEHVYDVLQETIRGIRIAEATKPFVKGLPTVSRNNARFIPHPEGNDLSLLAKHATVDAIPDADSDLSHVRLLVEFLSGKERVRMVTPWPGITSINSFELSANARHDVIVTQTFIERMKPDNLRGKIVSDIRDVGSEISLRGYTRKFPYMLVLAEETAAYESSFTESGAVAIWGQGDIEDNYSVFVQTKHPKILEWAEALYRSVSDGATRELPDLE